MTAAERRPDLRRPPWSLLIRLLAVALAALGAVAFVKGVLLGFWGDQASHDLRERHLEVLTFLDHHYPNRQVDPRLLRSTAPYSVYLPYAFPLMVPLFAGGTLLAGQLSVLLLSLMALLIMARDGFRRLRFAGPPLAWLGAAAALALNGIPPTLADMQFSLICTGLLLLQAELLERGRPWLAGICWALAMLKPQIALPFALLFLWRQQWQGLVAGSAILAALSGFTSLWTGISLNRILAIWLNSRQLNFTRGRLPLLPLDDAAARLIDPTLLQWCLIGLALAILLLLALWLRPRAGQIDLPTLTGLCSVIGLLAFYHRSYDSVMLYPALIALLRLALRQQGPWQPCISAMAIANGLLLWRPNNLGSQLPLAPLQTLLWSGAGLVLAGHLLTPERASEQRSRLGSQP